MQNNFSDKILEQYNDFSEKSIINRFIKHRNIVTLIQKRLDSKIFEISEIGKSLENREIFLLKYGTGKIKILIWSQMHGDEPTATSALFDIVNLLENPNFAKEQELISLKCSLFFIPMLNPDGAEVFKRRNAADIDINRDAVALQTPEAQILMEYCDKIKPDFGFNLHDQEIYYSAGETKFPAVLSFLTPAFDAKKSMDKSREKSMKIIAAVNRMLQNYIPNRIGRYPDDYLPSAFGDAVQKNGTSVILIESGGFNNDPEKQFVRKLNVLSLMTAFKTIADNSYIYEELNDYDSIPLNKKNKLFDYLIKNIRFDFNGKAISADIGIRIKQNFNENPNNKSWAIEDIGDLSNFGAFTEIDGKSKKIENRIAVGEDAVKILQDFNLPV
jgi:hypothetical protein